MSSLRNLGYGDIDKPKHPAAYKLEKKGEELMGLLDHLDIKQVVAIGHDCIRNFLDCQAVILVINTRGDHSSSDQWPTTSPNNLRTSYIVLDIVYLAPGSTGALSADAINDATTRLIGYTVFGCWHLFEAANVAELMDRAICSLPLYLLFKSTAKA